MIGGVELLAVDPAAPVTGAIVRAAAIVLAGGVVAYPTDTLYGLAADPWNADAVEGLFAIKGRAADQPIPLIAADIEHVEEHLGTMTALARRLADAFWPGPLTLLVAAPPGIVPAVHAGTGCVAVRVPDHAVARLLAAACGRPITSTSANRSGQPATRDPNDVRTALGERLGALLDAGRTPGGPPSTIVDATGPFPVLVRAGAVPWERVLESL